MVTELLTSHTVEETTAFLLRQFKSLNGPNPWCLLSELSPRLQPRGHMLTEVAGVLSREQESAKIIGAALAYRNPFSPTLWTLPIIAVDLNYRHNSIGRILAMSLFAAVRDLGGKTIMADTNIRADRGGSRQFLENVGFNPIEFGGILPGYFEGDLSETGLIFYRHLTDII